MRSLGGLALLLAGIGVALLVYLPAPVDSAASRSATIAAIKFAPVFRLGRFSPSIALSVPAPRGPRLAGLEIAAAAALQAAIANTRIRVGRRRSSSRQRLGRLSLRRAIPTPETSLHEKSSNSCGASAAIGAA